MAVKLTNYTNNLLALGCQFLVIVLFFFVTLRVVRAIVFVSGIMAVVMAVVVSVRGLGLSFVDSGEVLSLGSLDFVCVFWNSVVDDWVVDWSMVISWSWFVMSMVTAISDLCLGLSDEGEVLGFFVGNLSGVDWNSVHWCRSWLVSVMVVGGGVVVGRGSIMSWGGVVGWGVVSLSLGGSDGGEVKGFFVGDFGGVNWDSIHWCWGVSVVGGAFVVVVEAGLGFSDGGKVGVFSGDDFRGL
jgi:hypothetical protein